MAPSVLLVVFALFGVFNLANGDSTLSNLHQKLVENSDRDARPGQPNSRTEVSLGLTLNWLDMSAEGVLTAGMWREMQWRDERLQWSRRAHGGLKKVRIDASKIWTPDVTMTNKREGGPMRPCRREGHCGQAVVGNDGSVTLLVDEVVTFKCAEYFQRRRSIWDDFKCTLDFSFWSSEKGQLKFASNPEEPKLGPNFDVGSLEMASDPRSERKDSSSVVISLDLRRRFIVQQRDQMIFWNPLSPQ